jgi:hypothetical protein
MTVEFNEPTNFAVADLNGVITNTQFSFDDGWSLELFQDPLEQKINVELKYMPEESFLLVKTSKAVGESINEEDLFYYVDMERGFHVMNLWVYLEPEFGLSESQTEYMFNNLEKNEGSGSTYYLSIMLGFIKENYVALTTLGPKTKGMTLNRVPMMQPRMDGKNFLITWKFSEAILTFGIIIKTL